MKEAMEFKNTRYHTFICSSMGLYSSILYVVALKLEPHRYVPILSHDLNKYYVEIFKEFVDLAMVIEICGS